MNSNAVNTVREERDYLTDEDGNIIAEDGNIIAEDGNIIAEVKPVVAHTTVTRKHTALADKQVQAICTSIAKAGEGDIANYLLRNWFPRKSNELIARAYEASKAKGAHVVIDMLDYEKQQLTKYGSWDKLPSKIRRALS